MSIRDDEDYEDDQREQQVKKRKKLMNFSIESIMRPVAAGATPPVSANNNSTCKSPSTPAANHELNLARLNQIECRLDNKDMWDKFHSLDTEMIITKQGRRMFPPVRVTFNLANNQQALSELNPRDKYQVLMDILPYNNKRYRYAYHKSSWQQAGKADTPAETRLFLHPDGPFTLDQLKRQVISFEKIKLTNNDANKHGFIVLNSMHKYQPRIHLIVWRGKESQNLANAPIKLLDQEMGKTFIFSETIFTAVTAYQNHSITKLKIDSNPFAKGFRDSSRLTDLELESMQDLISDGQCTFSLQGPPPHGIPHFLFAAAQQAAAQQNGLSSQLAGPLEDPASALLRERTIMALDSFLQQQHMNQQQSSSASPQRRQSPASACQGANSQTTTNAAQHQHQQQQQAGGQPNKCSAPIITAPFPAAMPNLPPGHGFAQVPISQANGQAANLEHLLMQQQQHFAAAAMAAAVNSGTNQQHQKQQHHHHHLLNNLFAQPVPMAPSYHSTKTGEPLSPSSPTVSSSLQQEQQYLNQQNSYHSAPLGGALGQQFPHHYSAHQLQQFMMVMAQQHQAAALSAAAAAHHSSQSQKEETNGKSKLPIEQQASSNE